MTKHTIRTFNGVEIWAMDRRVLLVGGYVSMLAGWFANKVEGAARTMKIHYNGWPYGVRMSVSHDCLVYKCSSHAEAVGVMSLVAPAHSTTIREWFENRKYDKR